MGSYKKIGLSHEMGLIDTPPLIEGNQGIFLYNYFKIHALLKVGTWSFEGIIILLICFLNCQKALFTKKQAGFSKKYRVKSIRLAIL